MTKPDAFARAPGGLVGDPVAKAPRPLLPFPEPVVEDADWDHQDRGGAKRDAEVELEWLEQGVEPVEGRA